MIGLRFNQRSNKFNAKRTELDGVKFDSKAESAYYAVLKQREKIGEVSAIELQRAFNLIVNGQMLGKYRADFCFWDHVEDRFRAIDVKGVDTPLSKWKRKHVLAQYQINVEVVK